jgi:formylglycine-generating enzyme required for sulfatase activity
MKMFIHVLLIPYILLSQQQTTSSSPTLQQPTETSNPAQIKTEPKKSISNSIGMDFIFVEPRMFSMGSDDRGNNCKPLHRVRISQPFYIGKFEVTQKQWTAVMGNNPSALKAANHPVSGVSWRDCQEFIKKLNGRENTKKYRLPTEAEWEFAAVGGKLGIGDNHLYSGSNDVNEVAVYKDNSLEDSNPVGSLKPNELDIYDMSGNVWEWVSDWYDPAYYESSQDLDPIGPPHGEERVLRGGSWSSNSVNCTVTNRYKGKPDSKFIIYGFRLVMEVE